MMVQSAILGVFTCGSSSEFTLGYCFTRFGNERCKYEEMTGYEFDWFADQRKFAVVYPEGYKNNWNDCRKNATFPAKVENIDDVGFIKTLISEFVQKPG